MCPSSTSITKRKDSPNEATKGTCPICKKDVKVTDPHELSYQHKNCFPPVAKVYILVRTSDREDVPVPHYECKAETEVLGVYRTHRQAKRAKEEATEGWEGGEDDEGIKYHEGTNFISLFQIFEEYILGGDDDEDLSDSDGGD